jgi:hypothetical protein
MFVYKRGYDDNLLKRDCYCISTTYCRILTDIQVNGQYPGPTIEANWGDTIRVTVTNGLTDNGTDVRSSEIIPSMRLTYPDPLAWRQATQLRHL